MIRPLALFIGLRYIRAKRRTRFISFITGTSILGIIIGVWALISVLSVMNGFERELKSRLLAVAAHIEVSAPGGWLEDWRTAMSDVGKSVQLEGQAPFILTHAMVKQGNLVSPVIVRGINPELESAVSSIGQHMVNGDLDDLESGKFSIVIGEDLARRIGNVKVGDKIVIISSRARSTLVGVVPRLKRFTVAGIFNLNFYEYDNGLVLTHIDDLAKLQHVGDAVSGLRLKVGDVFESPLITRKLRSSLPPGYTVSDWTDQYSNLFEALKIERRVMFIILFLIVAVAAFNIISTLVMLVSDKSTDIAVLRTIGVSPRSVMGIFIVHGVVIGIVGTMFGAFVGVLTGLNMETLIPWAEQLFGTQFFPDDIYIITKFPAQLIWSDVIKISIASLVMCFVATIYPAWRASKVHPAEALRYD
ncbi:MAG: lipoprotein-releasing ABC transporter permease subunit [Acidiferrobacterales bacterium]|nr:lipoprotein-releasing ABC transporter permease subunit [Acidiferrobacterales bacterium]